jgi:hypothetical protein
MTGEPSAHNPVVSSKPLTLVRRMKSVKEDLMQFKCMAWGWIVSMAVRFKGRLRNTKALWFEIYHVLMVASLGLYTWSIKSFTVEWMDAQCARFARNDVNSDE